MKLKEFTEAVQEGLVKFSAAVETQMAAGTDDSWGEDMDEEDWHEYYMFWTGEHGVRGNYNETSS